MLTDVDIHNEIYLSRGAVGETDLIVYWQLLSQLGVDPDVAYTKAIGSADADLYLLNIFLRHHLAAFNAALAGSKRQLELDRKRLKADDPILAISTLALAKALEVAGRLGEAEPLLREVLAIRRGKTVYGTFELPQAINTLAEILFKTDRLEEAESLFREGMSLAQHLLPDEHHVRLALCNNFASLLSKIGRDDEAEQLFRHVLEVHRKLNNNAEDIGRSLTNLVGVLQKNKRYEEAEPLQREALDLVRSTLPEWHPDVATHFENLAVLLNMMGKSEEAESHFKSALLIRKERFDKYSDSESISRYTACLRCLAALLHHTGRSGDYRRLGEAEMLYREDLAIRRLHYANDPLFVAKSMIDLGVVLQDAGVLHDAGKFAEAESLYLEALPIYVKELGEDHQATKTIRNNLEACVDAQRCTATRQNLSITTQQGETTMSMRITEVIVKWLEEQEWEERPEVDEENQTSSTSFAHSISEDFSAMCYLESAEKAGFIKLYMYFNDSKIPSSKMDEVIKFVNLVNVGIPIGLLAVIPDKKVLRFYAAIDVEEATLEPRHISNLLGAGLRTMERRLPQFMAICFGGKTAEEALKIELEE